MATRREFIGRSACALAGAVAAGGTGRAGSAARLERIGLQLYTVRRELEKDLDGTLRRVAALGFRDVEFAGYAGRTATAVRAALRATGLASPSAHVSLADLRDRRDAALDDAATVGHGYVVLGWLAPADRASLDDYKRLAELLGRAGEAAAARGLRLGYHNHDFELVEMAGVVPYDLLIERTDPKLVALELDVYWITKAGRDPLAYFARHPGRFRLLHAKDMERGPGGGFTEVGRGRIDFAKVLRAAKAAGVEHVFVEQDETPGSPFDSIAASFAYLKSLDY